VAKGHGRLVPSPDKGADRTKAVRSREERYCFCRRDMRPADLPRE
jgi:hypothetical protein